MRLFALLFFLITFTASAQRIEIYKTFGGVQFERDGVAISVRQVQSILTTNPDAHALFKKARTNSSVASVMGFTGGLLIGVPLGTALVGGDPEWSLALAGAGVLVLSIPFNKAFQRNAVDALDQYNAQQPSTHALRGEFFLSSAGAGMRFRF
jgi:predicted MFS family arabinose efflux permease